MQAGHRVGFSLIEVLVALLLLAIGLLMVAMVFPVAGNWTRQTAEESIAQSMARNAVAIIKTRYGIDGPGSNALSSFNSAIVVPLPGIRSIPLGERAYQFGSPTPYPAANPPVCTYFWTALARLTPNQTGDGRSIDIYILVFHKGSPEQVFAPAPLTKHDQRAEEDDPSPTNPPYFPTLLATPSTPPTIILRIGEYGVGQNSGTLFRMVVGADGNGVAAPPMSSATDPLIWIAPPAIGTSASPLVYIYQTTISF
jgi:prepilin-type N-terminal cleavage/methylation domain-containing protein